MKKVLLTGDKIYDAYEEKKRDKTIILKEENIKNQSKPDTSKDNK